MIGPGFSKRLSRGATAAAAAAWFVVSIAPMSAYAAPTCDKPVYLTLDTGGMQSAELIAQTLRKHGVKATFFIANEKTFRGDFVLDDSWKAYWSSLVADGHAFGSHTWRHGRILSSENTMIRYRPQFGEDAGKLLKMGDEAFCSELRRVDDRFAALTSRKLDAIWRAPGGYTTPQSLRAAKACGYEHVHWSPAGFLGDELPSDRYPNQMLLDKALRDIRPGDVLMAHLGIWSRKDPYAPMLDALIGQLKSRGFCFLTVTAPHPASKIPR